MSIQLFQRATIAMAIAEALINNWGKSPRAAARTAMDWIKDISVALRAEINAEHSDVKAMNKAVDALDLLLEVVTYVREYEGKEK